ncbi:Heparinase ii iii family protein [Mycena kentingensis (nom. inval.)]|nr:Heparinase ii iii family protein [Mycena kentingensis (nom. inval.)]
MSHYNYNQNSGYGTANYTNHANESSAGFISGGQSSAPYGQKKKTSKWLKFGLPALILVLIGGGVAAAVILTRKKSDDEASSSSGSGSSAGSAKNAAILPTATNSQYMIPIYPSTTNTALYTEPTFSSSKTSLWPDDSFAPSSPNVLSVRPDRPRIIAPAYKWAALPELIANDAYMASWNASIFQNASQYYDLPPVVYNMDGDSGILDNSREVKMRIKAFAYAYRMTNDTTWADRTWAEIQNAAGNGSTPFGPDTDDKWNTNHFLDVAEMSAAFGIAYDWLHDIWTDEQKSKIITSLLRYGLRPGVAAYTDTTVYYGWWRTNITGNWNCVCNGGLTLASLAILGDDTSGVAEQLLGLTVDNAKQNCAQAVAEDGTWAETANYWYFGTTGHAEMTSALLSATGSHYGLLDTNKNFVNTGDFHMAVSGATSLFNYGDHGPGKFSTTANAMILYADLFQRPEFALFQRDQHDAAEPWSMFWYDPAVSGAFWNGRALDMFFDTDLDQWAAMRSSWTDNNALYVGVKAGKNKGHQTHNDLDAGTFVLDAMGTRWAGELGSGDYRSPGYFSSEEQTSDRYKYYRKMTEGQNTILIGQTNQDVNAAPTVKHDSSGTKQGSSTVMEVPSDSTAFWTTDMTSAYFNATSVKRGVRLLNARKQVLVQDEITASAPVMWRMHTNATVTANGASASLALDGKKMDVTILNAPTGATFTTSEAKRMDGDPAFPQGGSDQENPGVTVLIISLPAGQYSLQVLFNPQWEDGTNFTPPPREPSTMFIKHKTVSLTLLATLLTLASAHDFAAPRREHEVLKRFIKKRAGAGDGGLLGGGLINVVPDPNASASTTASASASAESALPSDSASASASNSASALSDSASQSASVSASDSASASVKASSTSDKPVVTPTPDAASDNTSVEIVHSPSIVTATQSTVVAAAATNPTSQQGAASEDDNKKSIITTILIVVGASVGGLAILWTVFRKWKLGTSKKFDARMEAIDWTPSTHDDDNGIVPAHRLARTSSRASSVNTSSQHGHGGYRDPLEHDFTAPPAHLAPVGGYADLTRGPSPQPQMQESLNRGPSLTHNNRSYGAYDTGVPLHHQAGYGNAEAYDYNGEAVRF